MRRAVLYAAMIAVTVAAMELVALVALRIVAGHWVGVAELAEERSLRGEGVLGEGDPEALRERNALSAERVLHPYLGYVKDADRRVRQMVGATNPEAGELGFPNNAYPVVQPRDPERLVAVVLGGSLANALVRHARPDLERALAEIPRFRGREVRVVSLAQPGYKQPQQLLALSYLISLGAHFDVAINLDGYNDLVAAVTNERLGGVAHFYPKRWAASVADLDRDFRLAVGEIAVLQREREARVEAFSRAPWRWSHLAGLVWKRLDQGLEDDIRRAELRLHDGGRELSFQTSGPRREYPTEAALYEDIVAVWRRASMQLDRLSGALGIEYYHFLQPNQYVPDSKPLSERERAEKIELGSRRDQIVRTGYPLLQRAGAELRGEGVAFHDLTPVFRGVESTIYIDVCCHVNPEGSRRIVAAIAEAVALRE